MNYDENALQQVRELRFLIDSYDAWIFRELQPFLGQRVLEVGCGLGNLLRHLQERELAVGIDLSEESIADVQGKFKDRPNVQAHAHDITDPSVLELAEHQFDTIVSLNLLEHIEDDALALQHMYNLLQPQGHLILIVPAHAWLYGSMDRSIGHYRRYTKSGLVKKLETAGFCVHKQKYLNAAGTIGWFINGRVLGQTVPPDSQLRVLNCIIPVIERAENLISPPIGISLFNTSQR